MHATAEAAKARIGEAVPGAPAAEPAASAPSGRSGPRPAVNFFAEEEALPGDAGAGDEAASLPDGNIAFDDFGGTNVDDDGVPMWEDSP